MKRLGIVALLIMLIGVGVYSCTKQNKPINQSVDQPNLENLNLKSSVALYSPIFLPNGTVIDSLNHPLIFTAPNGWQYLYELDNDNTARLGGGSGSVTCTCLGTTGACIAAYHRSGMFDCMNGTCDAGCEKKIETANSVNFTNIRQGGFIDFNAPVRAMILNEELPGVFSTMFKLNGVKIKLDSLKAEIYGNNTIPTPTTQGDKIIAPSGHKFVYMSAFGRGFAMLVPVSQMGKIAGGSSVSTGSITCSCIQSGGTCRQVIDGPWVFCVPEANCEGGCQLTVGSKKIQDQLVSIKFFRY